MKGRPKTKHGLKFYLLIAVVVIYAAAMIVRVYDAYLKGDVWLAFSRRSDVGYPTAHILAFVALIILLYAIFGLKRKLEVGYCIGLFLRQNVKKKEMGRDFLLFEF